MLFVVEVITYTNRYIELEYIKTGISQSAHYTTRVHFGTDIEGFERDDVIVKEDYNLTPSLPLYVIQGMTSAVNSGLCNYK